MNTEFQLPTLPYAFDALEPIIDAQTLQLHYEKHHAAYVAGANGAVAALKSARASGDFSLVGHWEHKLAFHASGHFLHSLFWESMGPASAAGAAAAEFARAVADSFGSVDAMKAEFSAAAKSVEGNGWAVLASAPGSGSLAVLQVENHQKHTLWSVVPLLACDVWEHAYYLKYQNRRADFVDAWWGLVQWPQLSARYARALGAR